MSVSARTLQRAIDYANTKCGVASGADDVFLAQRALIGARPKSQWFNAIRKFVAENTTGDTEPPSEETAEAAARYACEITKQDFEPRDIQDVIDEARDPSLRPTVWGLIAAAFCAGVRHGRDGAK